ncbi:MULTISPECIES: FAD-binding and (Fe-S)-binding domain-containing protein [Micromonospora]|uniref:FAD-binding oxidoreductase n=1 Tax=Micromonospora sicca TaxID=2202420 RepID=A0A317DLF5_9ACTN|nr:MULTISPECIES: FAD-binding and (Fe-S)-binding domain-containing protein [unclassified Micromonospora]MBM0224637.1 FAD-binding oxidoreductase [Micromonospora sp. ATA51]PWR15448.1 FAD-binding oxidoreductase [Micromonospora sp. 4G51]
MASTVTDSPKASAEAFLDDLRVRLGGLVDDSSLTRALYSTDASNYRIVPQAVLMPKSKDDVVAAVGIARAHGIPVTVRGGGTSCAGNAVGPGLVIDFSRFMNRILSVDPESSTAVVEPGTVLSTLQNAALPFGLRFGPDPSTATRCTIGGMIGNNACGPHGLSYGRTADNVVSMTWLTGHGEVITAGSGTNALKAVPGLDSFVSENLAVLRTEFGRFGRQISGYSLEHLLPENGRNVAAALTGTEGSCGILLEATVRLVPRASAPALAVLGYSDMAAAADDVPNLLPFHPLALEGLDAQLVDVVRRAHGSASVPRLPAGGGWLMAEVGGATSEEAVEAAQKLVTAASSADAVVLPAGPEATRLWQIRADGAGLAGRTAAGEQAWPGWEDSAVPPERLGDYLRGLEALMAEEGVSGLAYGHFGDGCVHVRIDFPLEVGGALMRRFLERAAALAAEHGGSLSGEHGDGRARSELLPTMYSPKALRAMEAFKALLDPEDLMNPGVVVRPAPLDADLRRPQALQIRATDGFAFAHDGGNITKSVHRCVGVGKCRADLRGQGGFMCPSYAASRDEKDSTRGRARTLQEMLNGGVLTLGWSSPEVHEALDLCLSCKACANDCPTGIDMAMFKSETLHQTYKGRLRPLSHYTLGRLPQWLKLAAPLAPLVNLASRIPLLRKTMMTMMGADTRRSLPPLPLTPFRWSKPPKPGKGKTDGHKVLLWVDSFSDAMAPDIPRDALKVLFAAGCDVEIASPGACCGLTLISTGQLTAAKAKLRKTLDLLLPHVRDGRTVVGLEPSCTATLRSDLLELLSDNPRAAELSRSVKTIAEFLTSIDWTPPQAAEKLLVQPHCHHYSIMGYNADQALLEAMGCDVETSAGCCGLAGNFGMEKGHYEVSEKIAQGGILAKASASPDRQILADGFSCRTQVHDLAGLDSRHVVQIIAEALRHETTTQR